MIPVLMYFEIEKGIPVEQMGFPESQLNGIKILKKEIYDRVKILEYEASNQPNGRIILNLSYPSIVYEYSGELGRKMKECISESDYTYFLNKMAILFPPMP